MTKRMLHETPLLVAAAMMAHEANREYCQLLGDDSQVPWDEAPEWQKDSAIAGVSAIHAKPDTSPEASHESWMAQKLEDGWIYGAEKDEDAKEHPCILAYDALPDEQKLKPRSSARSCARYSSA